ncbi:MAG: NADH-quinone oxidoreductase subunit NuoE [Bacteroidota bacterium]
MRVKRVYLKEENAVLPTPDLSQLDYLIHKYKNRKGNLIPLLQGTQELFGYVPREAFEKIAAETGIKLSEMYGVATFYAQFRLNPVGKYVIKVCHGTACHVQNANSITDSLKESLGVLDGGTTDDNLFTLESVACLGCCSLAPVMMVKGETYGKLSGGSCVKIIKNIRLQENN